MEHAGLLHDTNFWVLSSTLLFAVLVYVKGRGPLLNILDSRTARIKAELDEAGRLREEAQELLAETQRQHREALQTAQRIIENAKETAGRIESDSNAKMDEAQKRREDQLLERISRAESTAVAELRRQAADIAAKAAEQLLRDNLAKSGAGLIDRAIDDIPAKAVG
jgi:F-type H+-transporting ATPase subunit b